MNLLVGSVILALVVTGAPAWAQGKLDVHTMKAFGGTYQVECGNNAAPKATVFADAENNTVLLSSSAPEVVYGKVYQRGKSTVSGAPPPAVASELEALWKKEWRSQPK